MNKMTVKQFKETVGSEAWVMLAMDLGEVITVFEGKAKFIPAKYLDMNVYSKVRVEEQDEFSEETVAAMDAEVDAFEEAGEEDYELEIWKVFIN